MSILKLVAVSLPLTAVAVGWVEGDLMPHPEPYRYVKFTEAEYEAEKSTRESLNRLAEFMPSLCRDVWVGQGIVRVQREEARKGRVVPQVCAP